MEENEDGRVFGLSREQLLGFNQGIVEEFRANEGRCGGVFEGNPMILLTMTGARSGRTLTTPLTYCADGDDCIVFASAGGSPRHPAWYHNLVAHPEVTIERDTETYAATAVVTSGDDRAAAFDLMVSTMPRFAEYQDQVEREIPVVRLVRTPGG